MRNFIVLVILSVMSFFPSLANTQKHLTFKGIEMNMTTSAFVDSLNINNDYDIGEYTGKECTLYGIFANKEASIHILGSPKKGIVHTICVSYFYHDARCRDWTELIVNDYNFYVNLYSQKYGKPFYYTKIEVSKPFNRYNLNRYSHFITKYKIDGGTISIEIDVIERRLCITYQDLMNFKLNEKEAKVTNYSDI